MTQSVLNKEITRTDLEKIFKVLAINSKDAREFNLFTGQSGMDSLSRAFTVANAQEQVTFLLEKKVFSEEEAKNLHSMIKSDDQENLELALSIIAVKSEPFFKNLLK